MLNMINCYWLVNTSGKFDLVNDAFDLCLFAVVMHRGTFQWKGQYENAALDTG